MKVHNYRELKIWQKSRSLVKTVYQLTLDFPKEESYGLVSQIKRASVSIAANIAEGAGRGTNKDFIHFLNIARGSLFELETLLILSDDLKFLTEEKLKTVLDSINEILRMIVTFQDMLNNN